MRSNLTRNNLQNGFDNSKNINEPNFLVYSVVFYVSFVFFAGAFCGNATVAAASSVSFSPSRRLDSGVMAAAVEPKAQTCASDSLWRELGGPKVTVKIGDRTLHIPSALPYFRHLDENGRHSAWFNFHIDSTGQWSFGGPVPDQPYAWEYLLTFFVIDAPGKITRSAFLEMFLDDKHEDEKLSKENALYNVYPAVGEDTFGGKGQNTNLVLMCWNNIPFLKRKQVPFCYGFDRPWPNVSLEYIFGREFLPIAPQIVSCVNAFLDDLSR